MPSDSISTKFRVRPDAFGAAGGSEDGTPIAIIPLDIPMAIVAPLPSKVDLELLHLQAYRADRAVSGSDVYVGEPAVGDNPPDFFLETPSGQRRGVDMTQLMSSPRRQVVRMTEQLLTEVESRSQGFVRLDGWTVMLRSRPPRPCPSAG